MKTVLLAMFAIVCILLSGCTTSDMNKWKALVQDANRTIFEFNSEILAKRDAYFKQRHEWITANKCIFDEIYHQECVKENGQLNPGPKNRPQENLILERTYARIEQEFLPQMAGTAKDAGIVVHELEWEESKQKDIVCCKPKKSEKVKYVTYFFPK